METNFSTKIISLHLQDTNSCSKICPHRDVCYHHNKETGPSINVEDIRDWAVKLGAVVHEALCHNPLDDRHIMKLLNRGYSNYNITISDVLYTRIKKDLEKYLPLRQMQVTMYSLVRLRNKPKELTGIILIESMSTLYCILQDDSLENVHLAINSDKFSDKEILTIIQTVGIYFRSMFKRNITLDSILSGYIFYKDHPYKKDYIDITYDGSIRTNPFSKDSVSHWLNYKPPRSDVADYLFQEKEFKHEKYDRIFKNLKEKQNGR